MYWATIPAEEIKRQGVRVGATPGPLTQDRFTGWLYQDYLVVVHEDGDEVDREPHVCAVFEQGKLVWLDTIADAGRAILTAAGVR
jgi:hypothetical protein